MFIILQSSHSRYSSYCIYLQYQKSQVKLGMTKALGSTNHFGKRSYAQVVATCNQIPNHSASFNTLPVNSLKGSNPSHAKQCNRGNSPLYSTLSHKVSAQSSNPPIVHKHKGTSTKVLYKQENMAEDSRQASIDLQGKLYQSLSSTKSNPEQEVLVYNRYHILESLNHNCENYQHGTIDTFNSQYQSCSKNTIPVAKNKNEVDTNLPCPVDLENNHYTSQPNRVTRADLLHNKAANSSQMDTLVTEPC